MIKTLIFNGCSFVAGDALTWDEFNKELTWEDCISRMGIDKRCQDLYQDYVINFRPRTNLSGKCGQMLNVSVIDLSMDGNSNDNIVFDTINLIETMEESKKEGLCVLIGWSEISRRVRWSRKLNNTMNLSASLYSKEDHKEHHRFIEEVVVNSDYCDHLLNYVGSIRCLESYLNSKNIPFIFWRGLGSTPDDHSGRIRILASQGPGLPARQSVRIRFDDSRWIVFGEVESDIWIRECWYSHFVQDPERNLISRTNWHPSLPAVNDLAKRLVDAVRTRFDN